MPDRAFAKDVGPSQSVPRAPGCGLRSWKASTAAVLFRVTCESASAGERGDTGAGAEWRVRAHWRCARDVWHHPAMDSEALASFLAPLLQFDWEASGCSRRGPLAEAGDLEPQRYCSVPPEAVPIMHLHVDGCHYAAWIDDPSHVRESPIVVLVSPMDSTPETVKFVAPSVEVFAQLIDPDDEFLVRSDPRISRARRLAREKRRAMITCSTSDRLGVVDPCSAKRMRVVDELARLPGLIRMQLERGRTAEALVLVRNGISRRAFTQNGFAETAAEVYAALGRPEYARVALRSYVPVDQSGWPT